LLKYKNPALAVDIIIEHENEIVLITRKHEPYKDTYAIPGGFVEYGELVEHAAIREAYEETKLRIELKEILGCYSKADRDPRKHVISIVFIASTNDHTPEGSDDAKTAQFFPISEINQLNLAFDHKQILQDYIIWKKKGGTYWSTKEKE